MSDYSHNKELVLCGCRRKRKRCDAVGSTGLGAHHWTTMWSSGQCFCTGKYSGDLKVVCRLLIDSVCMYQIG